MTIPAKKPSEYQTIGHLNWSEAFPYAPVVLFRTWHDGKRFHIEYVVEEETTKAEQTELGGPVYQDSCVECFIQPDPDDPHYYNFEWNAAGSLAMACRTGREDPEDAPLDVIRSVKVKPSLGRKPFPEKAVGRWSLEVSIPVTALFRSKLDSWSGKRMRMNFFKCGDGLRTPHFITWGPIDTPAPDYHRPEFFQEVVFE